MIRQRTHLLFNIRHPVKHEKGGKREKVQRKPQKSSYQLSFTLSGHCGCEILMIASSLPWFYFFIIIVKPIYPCCPLQTKINCIVFNEF